MKEQSIILKADDPERLRMERNLTSDHLMGTPMECLKYQKTVFHDNDSCFYVKDTWVHHFIYEDPTFSHGKARHTLEVAATSDWTPQSQNPNITFQFAILTDGAFTYVAHLPITSHQILFDSGLYIKDMGLSIKGVKIEPIY